MDTQRTPVCIHRTPITVLSKAGHIKSGGWYVFLKPEDEEPPKVQLKKNERLLWCPWCADWSIYVKNYGEDRHSCTCCWAHTEEFYVRHFNKLWFEDVPLEVLRKLEIPRPSGRK